MTNRRTFLQALAVLGAARALPAAPGLAVAGLPRVKVSPQRLIRTAVGLRPYRPEGFVLQAAPFGEQLVIHNYGHGGAGITLSWGCAQLACDLLQGMERAPVAVLGGGVMGLTTARELQRRGYSVTIYTKDLPPNTTSNIAGGYWYPVSVFDYKRVTPEFRKQFETACTLAHRRFQEQVGADPAVRWLQAYEFRSKPEDVRRRMPGGDHLYPENRVYGDALTQFGFPHVRGFQTMIIEPHGFLSGLLRDFYGAGGKLHVREFQAPEQLASLNETVVFNCTGLGSRALFGDEMLTPARGQLAILLPQPEINYCYTSPHGYMFPRRDGIVLGGSNEVGNWSLDSNPAQVDTILAGNARVARGLR
jgi:D-amino-acid oxidase